MSNAAPAANWFPDPTDPAQLRWWDGVQWTEHVHAAAPAQPRGREFLGMQVRINGDDGTGNVDLTEQGKVFSIGVGDNRSDGFARSSSAAATPDWTPELEARERAEMAGQGLTAEQIDQTVKVQRAASGFIRRLEGSALTRGLGHMLLREMARRTARGGRGDSMDITFAGKRYQAQGSRFDRT